MLAKKENFQTVMYSMSFEHVLQNINRNCRYAFRDNYNKYYYYYYHH